MSFEFDYRVYKTKVLNRINLLEIKLIAISGYQFGLAFSGNVVPI